MEIIVNGKAMSLEKTLSVDELLSFLGYNNRFVAVARNQVCVPKSIYQETFIAENDDIEILAPMSGG